MDPDTTASAGDTGGRSPKLQSSDTIMFKRASKSRRDPSLFTSKTSFTSEDILDSPPTSDATSTARASPFEGGMQTPPSSKPTMSGDSGPSSIGHHAPLYGSTESIKFKRTSTKNDPTIFTKSFTHRSRLDTDALLASSTSGQGASIVDNPQSSSGNDHQVTTEPSVPTTSVMFKCPSRKDASYFLSIPKEKLEELERAEAEEEAALPQPSQPITSPDPVGQPDFSPIPSPAVTSGLDDAQAHAYGQERHVMHAATASQNFPSSRSLPQTLQSEAGDPNDASTIMSEISKKLRNSRIDPGKTTVFGKGGAAATALAAVASILGSAVLAALISPSEVIFTHLDSNIYRYNFCHVSYGETRDEFCNRMRVMYSLCCVITLIFDLLCLLSTIIVAIGLNAWLTLAYMFFMLAILTQTLALIAALWLAFPVSAAMGGTVLFIAFLAASTVFVLPGIALAWHFKFGLNKSLVLEKSGKERSWTRFGWKCCRDGDANDNVIEGSTVLHWAAYKGAYKHRLLAGVLLAAGESVDVPAQGAEGWTPLMIAAYRGNDTIVKQLLAAEADVQLTDMSNGRTALHLAAMKGNKSTVELLLKAGSDPLLNDELGATPVERAREAGHKEVVAWIENFMTERLNGELITAAKRRKAERMEQLLKAKASPNSKDARGATALTWAASRRFEDGVKLLLEAGADVNIANSHGSTALIEAALAGSATVVQLLLDKGADTAIAQKEGYTALDMAARRGHAEVVQALLTRVNTVAREAVDQAAKYGKSAALRILLTRVRERNMSCRTMLQAAAFVGSEPAVKLYLERGDLARDDTSELTALHCAAQEGHVKVVEALLAGGAKTERGDAVGKTPLHWAAQLGLKDVVRALLAGGAQIDCLDDHKRTPLHYAAENGEVGVAEILLERGADVNILDIELRTPLNLAVSKAQKKVTSVLLGHGADLASKDSMGRTALDIAKEKGDTSLVAHLTRAATGKWSTKKPERRLSLPV